jgi:hypothetical protein
MTDHPDWCAQERVACDGSLHRSAEYTVPGNDISDTEAVTQLWASGDRVFVQFVLATVYDGKPLELPPDPVLVIEPHAHDLTIDQALQLHQALGELIMTAGPR